jgi:hypothetical protein
MKGKEIKKNAKLLIQVFYLKKIKSSARRKVKIIITTM